MRTQLLSLGVVALLGVAPSASAQLAAYGIGPVNGGTSRFSHDYLLDDGTQDEAIGLIGGGAIMYLNRFTVTAGREYLTGISIAPGLFGSGNARDIILKVFRVNGDPSNPANLQNIYKADAVLEGPRSDDFQKFNVGGPNVFLGNAGDEFMVGFWVNSLDGDFLGAIDQTASQGMSWAMAGSDPNDISTWTIWGVIDSFGFPGNWMIRANAVPAPGALALLGLGGLATVRRRR
ncbi:MAG: PEP-CTERM sorting domain-containing protein [Phycisphaeraceae bacterium]|nr:PEP-CTERM sorting domain-containing protein [Phycisphaeraceae bacterium]MCW5763489.1 PEP-CTERM sorting domain-containing protein [Phycisphaeraceae bacterium]